MFGWNCKPLFYLLIHSIIGSITHTLLSVNGAVSTKRLLSNTDGKIEAGLEDKHYNIEHLYKIAKALDVDICEFFID